MLDADTVTTAFRGLFRLLVAIILPVYLKRYGPGNFLWFSDIALLGVFAAF
jgi:hypothetical protein